MSKLRKVISIFLVFSLIFCIITPASAAPLSSSSNQLPVIDTDQETYFAPGVVLVINGVTFIVTSGAFTLIAIELGHHSEEIRENLGCVVKCVETKIKEVLSAKDWIKVSSPETISILTTYYEAAAGSAGGKKDDDKWFFEARKNHGDIEINPKAMTEEEALKEMARGKNIMTVLKQHARELVELYERKPLDKSRFASPHQLGKKGYYDHINYNAKGMRLHCWIWRP